MTDDTIQGERLQAPHSSGMEPPRTRAPAGATDCHMHIFDPRFPTLPGRTETPASVEDYGLFRRRLGLSRCVVVAASSHGTDNSNLLAALTALGDTARGIASIDASTTDAELDRLHGAGTRGIRLNFRRSAGVTADLVPLLGPRLATRGWHMQVSMVADSLPDAEDTLLALPCPIVIDHFGHLPPDTGTRHPAFATIRRLVDAGRTWVKMTGPYLHSLSGPPDYADVSAMVPDFVKAAPERLVWGSDWPHITAQGAKPDGAALFDLLAAWVPDAALRRRILVDNPATLYDFAQS